MSMSTVEQEPPLVAGDFLTLDEFLRRWEAMPEVQRAELIRGVVYMPSPVSPDHAEMENNVGTWLGVYRAYTPGCQAGNNATWLMEEEAPQPDTSLWIRSEYGGKARLRGRLLEGAPDFLAEVCLSSAAYDLNQKLDVYQAAGVQEYLAVLIHERQLRWHRLTRRRFKVVPVPADGIHRSSVFPGLWLDVPALLGNDLAGVLKVLQEGIGSPEHEAFVKRLEARQGRG
jgi:Putative restriction endonuclease